MDARITRAVALTALLLVSMGARHRSANFIIETADPRLAVQFAEAAEKYRHDLAIEWLGSSMPNWSQPCPVTVMVGPNLGAGGATTFVFDRGEVFGWRMSIQGSAQRILDSVLPHEITHMIYASRFRRPLPRWADEGGATSVENISERSKHRRMLDQFLRTGRGISFSQMFAMTEYPPDVMPLYAQGYSLAEYLIQVGDRRKYVEFLDDGLKNGDWSGAVARNYGIHDLGQLQNTWLAWVKQGMPEMRARDAQPGASPEMLAVNTNPARPVSGSVYQQRSQGSAASTRAIPIGRLVPVPGSMLNPAMAMNNPRITPNNRPSNQPGLSTNALSKPTPFTSVAAGTGIQVGRNHGAVQIAAASGVLPSSGWRNAGTQPSPPATLAQTLVDPRQAPSQQPSQAPQVDPFQSQVTRPQDVEQPRQVILEWSAR